MTLTQNGTAPGSELHLANQMTHAEQIAALETQILEASRTAWQCVQTLDQDGMRKALAEAKALTLRRLELINAQG